MVSVDRRLEQLKIWLQDDLAYQVDGLEVVSGDASFRRYFRANLKKAGEARTVVLMDAPPAQEDTRPFVAIAKQLQRYEVMAPVVLAENTEKGYLMLTDLGNEMLWTTLDAKPQAADDYYMKSLQVLVKLQVAAANDAENLPPYDEALLNQEMALFCDWLVGRHLDLIMPSEVSRCLSLLVDSALMQPKVFVHRDYHSRNLMLVNGEVALIDFQDAVYGPITYDAVSLLRDCYIKWPTEKVTAWLQGYYQQLITTGALSEVSFDDFKRWFDWMGVQRHLKASGIFCRLNYRDGKAAYMNDIPLTLSYIVSVAAQYNELQPLANYVTEQILPRFEV